MSLLPKKYTNVQPLTPGKNASVFKAKNSYLNRDVFLKIYDVPANDPKSALQEPQLLQSLAHPNLVRIFSADALTDNRLLLEMEIVSGGSLQDLIDCAVNGRVWPEVSRVLAIVADIAHGLSALHAKGLVHRDIKPANVMVRSEQDRDHGVVTDLGLASSLDNSGRAFSSRHARIYRPPEVWAGKGYSKASDVYQLGILLYQLIGGTVPYEKSNLDDAVLASLTITGSLLDLTDVGPHVERTLRTLIANCICAEQKRLATMPDFLSALQAVRKSHLDWTYSVTQNGFKLSRTDNARQYLISVASMGRKHRVTGRKTIGEGTPRRLFPDQVITHADIGRSLEFRKLVKKT